MKELKKKKEVKNKSNVNPWMCDMSPDNSHHPQRPDRNTIHGCKYCGKVL